MGAHKAKAYRATRNKHDEDDESRIRAACEWLRQEKVVNMAAAAKKYQVSYHKLRRRYLRLHAPPRDSQRKRMLLTLTQETVLVCWMQFWALRGTPVSRSSLRVKVQKLTGRKPSRSWTYNFHQRHQEFVYCKATPLDGKRAACFNSTAVKKHFETYLEILEKYGPFKPCNIYNMDEKGVQLGGGRKSSGLKFFLCRHQREKYRKRSAELELITIIESVSADGHALTPGFIFNSAHFDMAWFEGVPDAEHIW